MTPSPDPTETPTCGAVSPDDQFRCNLEPGPHAAHQCLQEGGEIVWPAAPVSPARSSPETVRCATCGRECEPVNTSDAPVTHCIDCARSARSSLEPSGFLVTNARGIACGYWARQQSAQGTADELNARPDLDNSQKPFRVVPLYSGEHLAAREAAHERELASFRALVKLHIGDNVKLAAERDELKSRLATLVQRDARITRLMQAVDSLLRAAPDSLREIPPADYRSVLEEIALLTRAPVTTPTGLRLMLDSIQECVDRVLVAIPAQAASLLSEDTKRLDRDHMAEAGMCPECQSVECEHVWSAPALSPEEPTPSAKTFSGTPSEKTP